MSNLPGCELQVRTGDVCESSTCIGREIPATHCVQGETDSLGHERLPCCTKCHSELIKTLREERQAADVKLAYCDWCRIEALGVRPYRSSDEGMSGPVYDVCEVCRLRDSAALEEELRGLDEGWGY
jgi:hypothetical protein